MPNAATKSQATRKATTAKRSKAPRTRKAKPPAGSMPAPVRAAAAAALAVFEERLLDQENTGFVGAATRELKGARSGMVKAVRFEIDGNKHRAAITIAYR